MKVQNPPSFKGALNNRYVLSGLKKISEHATSFQAVTSLVMSTGVRTFSILNTPNVEKENKQHAAANSICSGLVKFGIVEAVALPLENMIKKIDKNPQKYLDSAAIKFYKTGSNSRSFRFITQVIKQSTGFLTAIPKSYLTIALLPVIMGTFFTEKPAPGKRTPVNTKHPSFKHRLTELTGKFLSLKRVRDFAQKYYKHDKDINKHMTAATDILLTTSSVVQINRSKDIKENRKKPLAYNNIISTGATLLLGYGADSAIKKPGNKFIEKFSKINKLDPNLPKYIEGLNILRPTLIFALIYYGLLPVFSTFLSERADKFINKHSS